jgi:hypothetical protein
MRFASKLTAYSREEIVNSLCVYMHSQTSVDCASISFKVASALDSYRVASSSAGVGFQSIILSFSSTYSRL